MRILHNFTTNKITSTKASAFAKRGKGRYYAIIGVSRDENGLVDANYLLCYTSNRTAAMQYYRANGWKKENLLFRVHTK